MAYYVDDIVDKGWSVAMHLKPRDLYNMGEVLEEEIYENEPYQAQELEQFFVDGDGYAQLATDHIIDDIVESNVTSNQEADEMCVEAGVLYLNSKVDRIVEGTSGQSLVECEGDFVIPCRFVTVASGAASKKFLQYELGANMEFLRPPSMEGLDALLSKTNGSLMKNMTGTNDSTNHQVFLFQKAAVYKCNIAGKPAAITRVVDSMTDYLKPTRVEAIDIANSVLDGSDTILLGAETPRGLYPVETISTVGKICAEISTAQISSPFQAEKVYNEDVYFKRDVKYVLLSKLRHMLFIICFTSLWRAARLIAKYRPTMPVLFVVIPQLKTNQLRWTFSGAFQARQSLLVRGIFPILADPRHPV
ncbi:putative mRNA cap guanine-N7 methyltransferase 2-like isoform X1 [Capsicum annuum]|uniref:Pyruvate kinase n=1 Tax=Capsicum annuum TaxID=4072 RepID=A0A2G3AKX0_CAPAN|nr:putative mRNA cap guanine-N7 methyltransferase 2-like isoform X1 [Capsicum annuum]KAF3634033.1 putative mRNA cap guanine-N7 methyltransferase 2-like isoform X1 [Capsicum annuum]PHT94897.1 hypothetical protein T459_02779 [Capsicum annuum]